jgi:hypothetical protein
VNAYRRKLSREDAETGTLLITKNRWPYFPRPMRQFTLVSRRDRVVTRIVAEDCACVAPPHQHYHLEAGHLRGSLRFHVGDVVEILRTREDEYIIRNG